MLLATNTDQLKWRFGEKEAIEMIAKAGFDAYDFSMFDLPNEGNPLNGDDWLAYATELRRTADAYNLPCVQAHAPFPSMKMELSTLKRAIEIASVLGCRVLVIHPDNAFTPEENATKLFDHLLPLAIEKNVRIATENMWEWDPVNKIAFTASCSGEGDFAANVDRMASSFFGGCVDIGHAEMRNVARGAAAMIRELGKGRLFALHVHDNDRQNDLHEIPFQGKIQWEPIIEALREVEYQGDFVFEVCTLNNVPKELVFDTLVYLEKIGRYFVRRLKG